MGAEYPNVSKDRDELSNMIDKLHLTDEVYMYKLCTYIFIYICFKHTWNIYKCWPFTNIKEMFETLED